MQLSPARKGMLTKAAKQEDPLLRFHGVRLVFSRIMPAEQAKHAAKRFLRERAR